MSRAGVSIIICCYNSESRLSETLRHIAQMEGPPSLELELVVVDNRCTDNTVDLARRWHRTEGGKVLLTLIYESTPGLTSARIAGVRAAAHETLIFCDDDNWLAADYCVTAAEILARYPDIGLAGGCSYAVPEVTPPEWFWPLSGAWAVGESDYIGPLSGSDAFLRGAGLVVRRSAFLRLLDTGFAFIASDRCGSSLNSGGDAEISREFGRLGFGLYFDARLTLQHWIPKERLTRSYALKLWQGFGAGTIAGDADRIANHSQEKIRNAIRTNWGYQIARGLLNVIACMRWHPIFFPENPTAALTWCSRYGRLYALWQIGHRYGSLINRRVAWIQRQTHRELRVAPTDR